MRLNFGRRNKVRGFISDLNVVQKRTQNSVKHLRRSFFGKIVYDYKPLANYFCKKAPSWMLDRILNRSMKFM